MEYKKKPLSLTEQVGKLAVRGLIIDDEELAKRYLSNISYYRLRAYTYPFQENADETADHHFIRTGIHFSDIIDLYCFDRRLRSLLFNAIEKIEVAVRAKRYRCMRKPQETATGSQTRICFNIKR